MFGLMLAVGSIGASGPVPAARADVVAPKVAIVLVGDPDSTLTSAADRVEACLRQEGYRLPADGAMTRALRGAGEADDGLNEIRAERRRLGLSPERDRARLSLIGSQLGATALLVVRASPSEPGLSVFNVAARAFYEGDLLLSSHLEDGRVRRFIARRVRAAVRRSSEAATTPGATPSSAVTPSRASTRRMPPAPAPPAPAPPGGRKPESVDPPGSRNRRTASSRVAATAREAPEAGASPDSLAAPAPGREGDNDAKDFFSEWWPYAAAGALLIGMVTVILVTTSEGDAAQPTLRFVPGGAAP